MLYAFDVSSDGTGRALTPDDLARPKVEGAAFRWIHLDMGVAGARDWLAGRIDEVAAASLTLEDTRPRCARHNGGALINMRGVNLNPDADPEDMVSIRMWVTPGEIVSVRIRRLLAVVALREAIERGDGPEDVGAFLAELAAGLTEKMDGVIMGLADRVDELEAESLDRREGLRAELASIRRKTIILRRYVGPQREALAGLAAGFAIGVSGEGGLVDAAATTRLRETADRVTRMVEELDAVRERCAILNDQLADARAEEMNAQLMVLSVVAAIFLPLGFATGLLGVNVGGIPGADEPAAFAVLCALLTAMGGALAWWFHKRGWL